MITFTWLFPFTLLILPLVGIWGKIDFDKDRNSCAIMPDENGKNPKMFIALFVLVVPMFFTIGCYCAIFLKIKRMRKELKNCFSQIRE